MMANTTPLLEKRRPVDRQALVERARAMVPALRERAPQAERDRRISNETVAMFRDADLFKVLQPAEFGGFEADFALMMDVINEIGRGCGSSAWLYGLGAVHMWLMALFPIEAQRDVWGSDPGAIVTGSYAPQGMVQVEPGGYRITGGRYAFASGVDHSHWSFVGVIFPPAEGQPTPVPGLLLVPSTDYTIEDDWQTYGLCGTGSKSIMLKDVFVPEHRKLTFPQAASGKSPGAQAHESALYKISFLAALPCAIATPAFGIVQGAIEDVLAHITSQVTRGAAAGAGNRMADFAAVQTRMAEATACVDAAKLLLYRDCAEVMAAVQSGEGISVDMRIRNRRDHAFSIKLAVQAANALNESTGGRGLYLDNVVQRAWRDVNAVSKHITLNWDAVSTMVGQHYFGLEPKGAY
jgi:resorcinol 4-hydroxylase (FADH2)